MPSNSITIRRAGDTYTCDISIRDHRLVFDEPEDKGGVDDGPTPVEALTGTLGACTAITMQMYARRKGWRIDRLEIVVDHDTVNDPDATLEGRIVNRDRFRTRILLEGDLDGAQRQRIFDIAKRCPVHRMLAGSPIMVEEYVDSFDPGHE